jgi:hypothetical protein
VFIKPCPAQALSKYLEAGREVSVFADVTDTINAGSVPDEDAVGNNVILYLGEGVMRKNRAHVVDREDGVAVEVCASPARPPPYTYTGLSRCNPPTEPLFRWRHCASRRCLR